MKPLLPWRPTGRVLDACASTRKWWAGSDTSGVVFLDCLPSVSPDVVGSFTALPFKDAAFDGIVWDPPHLIRNDVKNWNPIYARFGNYKNRAQFESMWADAGAEFRRVLKPGGWVVVKYIYGKDYRVPNRDDISLLGLSEVDREERKSSVGWSTNTTAFVLMN